MKKAFKLTYSSSFASSTRFQKLKKNKKYYIPVRSYVMDGNTKIFTNWSNIKCVKTNKKPKYKNCPYPLNIKIDEGNGIYIYRLGHYSKYGNLTKINGSSNKKLRKDAKVVQKIISKRRTVHTTSHYYKYLDYVNGNPFYLNKSRTIGIQIDYCLTYCDDEDYFTNRISKTIRSKNIIKANKKARETSLFIRSIRHRFWQMNPFYFNQNPYHN